MNTPCQPVREVCHDHEQLSGIFPDPARLGGEQWPVAHSDCHGVVYPAVSGQSDGHLAESAGVRGGRRSQWIAVTGPD
ncbi:hypothetical protein XSR1_1390002 [Xenorhabdus szentirmaii DSM 16338]|uniref:Uncharacterized protein n=1 Tax=Xenorhabdus szentirmaii DSM 16338 TaxID=1427518 RepID=W1ISW0_9GAMM|nr:hypothetical protein XSR1_1390002 [Xenorhabdus szentirmaii DSM 16338]